MKGPIYARAGVPENWLADLQARTIEAQSDPALSGFTTVIRHAEDETLRLPRFPDVGISIRSVLPTAT